MEEEQHHWDDRRRGPDGSYHHGPPGPPGLLGVRPGMPPQPQGPAVSTARAVLLIFEAAGILERCNAINVTNTSLVFFNANYFLFVNSY